MSNSRNVNGERPGDPEGDLDYVPLLRPAMIDAARKRIKREKRDRRVESFINGNFGFVPNSRADITVATSDVNDQIEKIYRGVGHNRPTSAVGAFYNGLLTRRDFAGRELSYLDDANSPIGESKYDKSKFTVDALRESPSAMETLALFQIRASALATSNWTNLDRDNVEKAKRDELAFMGQLEPEELSVRWDAAWESLRKEFQFWDSMANAAELNPYVQYYIATDNARSRERQR